MSKFKHHVACIAAERDAQKAKKAFLDLLHADLYQRPDRVQPISASLMSRVADLRARAKANRKRDQLLEG